MTINDSFKLLLSRIEPTQAQIDATEQHLATIITRLKTVFILKDSSKTASYSRGTLRLCVRPGDARGHALQR